MDRAIHVLRESAWLMALVAVAIVDTLFPIALLLIVAHCVQVPP